MHVTRREFILQSCQACAGYALGAAAFAAGIDRFALINAFAQGSDYRALVCVFLAGGNDGNNMVIPAGASEYQAYSTVRSASGLAIPAADLLKINPPSAGEFGLHPSLSGIRDLWDSQNAAVVCNVGPLVQPLTRSSYLAGAPRPYQLFSHSDQIAQWQSAIADRVSATGWGGRAADRFAPHASGFPMVTAISGGLFTRGQTTSPLSIASAPTPLNQVLVLNGFNATSSSDAARRTSMEFLRTVDQDNALVRSASSTVQRALDIGEILSADVTLTTAFPNTTLGNQLRQIAKVIKFNSTSPDLGLQRQIFFCQLGGFDTHQGQVNTQANLLTQLNNAIAAFYSATMELGLAGQVTTFTLSDFGRTLQPAGSGAGVVGSDHAWGNHHFVVGGAVRGGDFYGTPGPNGSVFPALQLGGPSDTDSRGRWIPTVAVEQYAATLASWYGVASGDLPLVFPNIGRFDSANLGFMG